MKKWFKNNYPIILVLFVATILRLSLLFVRGTFWFDEMFSVHFSTLPWAESIKYWIIETNPFLYNLILRCYIFLFGDSELTIRLLSLFFALATIILIYLIGQKLFSRFTATVASLIIALSGVHIFLSTEARSYSLLVFLTTISFWLFIQIFVEKQNNKLIWLAFFIIQTLLLYTHLTALAIILIQIVLLGYFKKDNLEIAKKFLLTHGLALLIFCFWLIPSILQKLNTNSLNGWFFEPKNDSANIFTIIITLFINAKVNGLIFTLLAGILIYLFFLLYKKFPNLEKKSQQNIVILSAWGFIPLIIGSCLNQYITKYFVFSLPALALLVASTLDNLGDKTIKKMLTGFLLFLFLPSTIIMSTTPIFSWYSITNYIEKNETKESLILTVPFNEELPLKKYYHGISPALGVYPIADNLTLDERIVRFNWQKIQPKNNDLENWLTEKTTDKDKIYYIQYGESPNEIIAWLEKNNFKLNYKKTDNGHINLVLYEFYSANFKPDQN